VREKLRPGRALLLLPALGIGLAAWLAWPVIVDPGLLWRDPYHDRNTHFSSGLTFALALRQGDAMAFVAELARPSVWPPLQALALGGWMAATGPDLRAAILPALAGWVATLVALALLCGRAVADPARAVLAAGIAVALAMTSPAFGLLGTDAMMEVPGAALTAFLLLLATTRPVPWRGLAVLLTLLALHKYNYWSMAVAALLLAAPLEALIWTRRALGAIDRRRWREDAPLRALAACLGIGAALLPADPPWRAGGIMLLPVHVASLAWGCWLLAAARAWRRRGAAFDAAFGEPGRILAAWHALPVALWLLIPGKLAALLWFLSPGHAGATAPHGLADAAAFHWQGFALGFHHHPAIAAAVLALAGLGARRGPRVLGVFAALGIAALLLHPQLQWRFQATVLPAIWALAGIGAAVLLPRLPVPAAMALPVILAGGLLALPAPRLAEAVAVRRPDLPRDLDLAEAWRDLPAGGGVLVLSSIGRSDLFDWTIRLRCRCLAPVGQPPWLDFGDAAAAAAIRDTPAPWLLAVAMPAPYPLAGQAGGPALPVDAVLAAQRRFVQATVREVPAHGAHVALWQAAGPPEGPPPPRRRGLVEIAAGLLALASLATLIWPRRPPCASA
jgi:hypothetical protein